MSLDNLSLQHMRAFREVARSGSFTSAARRMSLSQSSLSRSVRQLERLLGVTLLQRDTRNVVVTAEGAQFLEFADDLLDGLSDGIDKFKRFADARVGTLSIATLASFAATVLPAVISDLLQTNEQLALHLIDAANDEVLTHVSRGDVEVGVGMAPDGDGTELQSVPILEDALWAVVPAAHRLALRSHVTWADFDGEAFVAARPGTSTRTLSDTGLHRAGARVWNRLEVANLATLGGLVRAGMGVSVIPSIEFDAYRLDGLTRLPIKDHCATRVLSVITSRERPLSPTARLFLRAVPTVLARLDLPPGLVAIPPG